jgi:transcriptional regulator with XRE-family HTH domain
MPGGYLQRRKNAILYSVKIEDLGRRLRTRRTSAGRTIASVAVDAGLSVPYIANLENGRGNPTLAAVASLAQALGLTLRIELDDGQAPEPDAIDIPAGLRQFARHKRFAGEAREISAATGQPPQETRERLLVALATTGALAGRPLDELDWHRLLDAVVLITR